MKNVIILSLISLIFYTGVNAFSVATQTIQKAQTEKSEQLETIYNLEK